MSWLLAAAARRWAAGARTRYAAAGGDPRQGVSRLLAMDFDIHRNGDVTYRLGRADQTITDTQAHVLVGRKDSASDDQTLELALRLAQMKFGPTLKDRWQRGLPTARRQIGGRTAHAGALRGCGPRADPAGRGTQRVTHENLMLLGRFAKGLGAQVIAFGQEGQANFAGCASCTGHR